MGMQISSLLKTFWTDTKKHKIGSIPVGVHASSTIENIEVGASIRVRYNPNKPKQSYLPENNGYHIS